MAGAGVACQAHTRGIEKDAQVQKEARHLHTVVANLVQTRHHPRVALLFEANVADICVSALPHGIRSLLRTLSAIRGRRAPAAAASTNRIQRYCPRYAVAAGIRLACQHKATPPGVHGQEVAQLYVDPVRPRHASDSFVCEDSQIQWLSAFGFDHGKQRS